LVKHGIGLKNSEERHRLGWIAVSHTWRYRGTESWAMSLKLGAHQYCPFDFIAMLKFNLVI